LVVVAVVYCGLVVVAVVYCGYYNYLIPWWWLWFGGGCGGVLWLL
jgi:hypothetical protein